MNTDEKVSMSNINRYYSLMKHEFVKDLYDYFDVSYNIKSTTCFEIVTKLRGENNYWNIFSLFKELVVLIR
jgi:hypothetical protein